MLCPDQKKNFNIPPASPGKPQPFSVSGEWGIWQPSVGAEFELCKGGVGKIEPEVSSFKWFFCSSTVVANSYNICLEDIEEFKGKDIAMNQVTGFFRF